MHTTGGLAAASGESRDLVYNVVVVVSPYQSHVVAGDSSHTRRLRPVSLKLSLQCGVGWRGVGCVTHRRNSNRHVLWNPCGSPLLDGEHRHTSRLRGVLALIYIPHFNQCGSLRRDLSEQAR